MKIIKQSSALPKEHILKVLSDSEFVNKNVTFDQSKPKMHLKMSKRNPDKIRITCEMTDSPTKDNGFLIGTYFSGKLVEKNGKTYLSGYIVTAPIYHAFLLGLLALFVVMCIVRQGFNPVPPILFIFDIIMFWREFKKQGLIERYISRAFKRAEKYK